MIKNIYKILKNVVNKLYKCMIDNYRGMFAFERLESEELSKEEIESLKQMINEKIRNSGSDSD